MIIKRNKLGIVIDDSKSDFYLNGESIIKGYKKFPNIYIFERISHENDIIRFGIKLKKNKNVKKNKFKIPTYINKDITNGNFIDHYSYKDYTEIITNKRRINGSYLRTFGIKLKITKENEKE